MKRRLASGALFVLAVLWADDAVAQCAMCRTALESPEAMALAGGFRRAVLFLLAVPFTVVGVIGALVVYRNRQVDED